MVTSEPRAQQNHVGEGSSGNGAAKQRGRRARAARAGGAEWLMEVQAVGGEGGSSILHVSGSVRFRGTVRVCAVGPIVCVAGCVVGTYCTTL